MYTVKKKFPLQKSSSVLVDSLVSKKVNKKIKMDLNFKHSMALLH